MGISTKGIDVRKAYDQGWVEEMQDAGRLPMSADQITHEMKLGLLRFESDSKFCVACRYCIYAYRGRFNPPKIEEFYCQGWGRYKKAPGTCRKWEEDGMVGTPYWSPRHIPGQLLPNQYSKHQIYEQWNTKDDELMDSDPAALFHYYMRCIEQLMENPVYPVYKTELIVEMLKLLVRSGNAAIKWIEGCDPKAIQWQVAEIQKERRVIFEYINHLT